MKNFGFITDLKTVNKDGSKVWSYYRWLDVIQRCYNQNSNSYKNYGAKGVIVCEEWKLFSNFKRWFDENYIEGYEIDKDLGGGKIYSPETCRFISKKENRVESSKRRDNSYLSHFSGRNSHRHKPKEYYLTKPTRRADFKIICKRNEWDMNDFVEIETKHKTKHGQSLYNYRSVN